MDGAFQSRRHVRVDDFRKMLTPTRSALQALSQIERRETTESHHERVGIRVDADEDVG